jgi:hypothetical protein
MNRIMRRPMFRKGGSAGEGITSGLAPRQGYNTNNNNIVQQNDLSKIDLGSMNMQQLRDLASQMAYKAPPMPVDRSLGNFKIDLGLDLLSRSPSGNIFQTVGAAAKEPFSRFRSSRGAYDKSIQDRAINKYNAEANMFKTLIGAQADILGSDSGGKTYRDIVIANELKEIIPQIYKLQAKVDNGTATQEDIIQLDTLKTQKNNFTKSNPVTDAALKIFVEGPGSTVYIDIIDDLFKKDKMEGGANKYTDKKDRQLLIDAINELKKLLGSFSGGGRAGYANGEMVMEEQVTETMTPGPQTPSMANPISYDQLRARLPKEITDDIVQLMANSAEALEDFASISTQQDVDQFNKKYNVNLVLPAEA